MVSMLDNEAQLAYVLGHEIAHVEKNHAYQIVRMSVLEPALNEEKEKETKEKRAIVGAAATFATGGLGGVYGGLSGAIGGGIAGLAAGIVGSNLIFRDHNTVTEWVGYLRERSGRRIAALHAGPGLRRARGAAAVCPTADGRRPEILASALDSWRRTPA